MKIQCKQQYPVTLVRMAGGKLIGVSSCRPGDTWDEALGLAVAIIKASKRIPKGERHFLDKLKDVAWKSMIISMETFGIMVQYMIGYRSACNGISDPDANYRVTFDVAPLPGKNVGHREWKKLKRLELDCVIAERVAKQLSGEISDTFYRIYR